jgi:hypothetical protein
MNPPGRERDEEGDSIVPVRRGWCCWPSVKLERREEVAEPEVGWGKGARRLVFSLVVGAGAWAAVEDVDDEEGPPASAEW